MSVVWNLPDWSSFVVEGPDAATWLHGLVTCNVTAIEAGRGSWGSLLTKQGKVQADLQLVRKDETLVVGVSGGKVREVLEVLDRYLVMEDAEVAESELRWVLAAGAEAAQQVESLGLEAHVLPWGETPVVAAVVEPSRLEALSIETSGAKWENLRVRSGWFRYGVDYSAADNLHAAALERRTVDWQKGCYLGQEVVCMQDMRGKAKKRLVVLGIDNGPNPPVGAKLFLEQSDVEEGNEVGHVTSSSEGWAIASVQVPADLPETQLFFRDGRAHVQAMGRPWN